jgi:cyclase
MRKRLIPVLLLDRDRRVVKTIGFADRTYIGDPFNVIRLFNEKEVDEICVLDIDASNDGREPDFIFLSELSSECFMPLSYGGGINCLNQCEKLGRNGVEKFIIGTSANTLNFIRELSENFGSQAVVVSVDVRKIGSDYRVFTTNGQFELSLSVIDYCKKLQDEGAGEIILQSINLDGARSGYDLNLISSISNNLEIPLVALGGAGDFQHFRDAINAGASAAASGSAFVFIGRLRAVLVNYPSPIFMD